MQITGAASKLVEKVAGEITPADPSAWQPTSFEEWNAREQTRTILNVWSDQMTHERSLRAKCANWAFALIALQVLAVFVLVMVDGMGVIRLNTTVLSILIPSVLTEVFGIGLIVTKYLFSQPLRQSIDSLLKGITNGR